MSRPLRDRSLSKPRMSRSNTPIGRNNPHNKTESVNQIFGGVVSPEAEATDEYADEELDPRVQEELERLNLCTDQINQLENELEDANCLFRVLLTDSTQHLKSVAKKTGTSVIEKARPYYEATEAAKKAQKECQSAATAYQRAFGVHAAAKETITLAEQRFLSNSNTWEFDNAWQEMLNHATIKVMAAEKQKTDSEIEHYKALESQKKCAEEVQRLQKKLQRHIQASQPYFEQKDIFNAALESQKKRVQDLQEKVTQAKALYSKSLRNLEDISESIHARRKLRHLWSHPSISDREPGVGAELEYDLDVCDRASSRSTTSGKSASKAGSECESIEILQTAVDESCIKLSELVEQLKDVSVKEEQQLVMTRTASTPALNQLRQHMMGEPSTSMCQLNFLNFPDDKQEDNTVTGLEMACGPSIDL